MTTTRRLSLAYLALTAGVAVLFALNLFWGSVSLTPGAVAAALLGRGGAGLPHRPGLCRTRLRRRGLRRCGGLGPVPTEPGPGKGQVL